MLRFTLVRDSGGQVAAYLATYLLPLLAAPSPSTGDIVGYFLYGVVLVVVTVRSELIHVNPTVYLLGWTIVTVRLEGGREQYALCKRPPAVDVATMTREFHGVLRVEDSD
jgi:hypothetical protein